MRPYITEALRLMNGAGDWLNPRRRHQVECLICHLAWIGGRRAWLGWRFYAGFRDEYQIHRAQADQAIDDAFELGIITMRPSGGTFVIELLVDDVDDPPVMPRPQHRQNGHPQPRRRPAWERGRA